MPTMDGAILAPRRRVRPSCHQTSPAVVWVDVAEHEVRIWRLGSENRTHVRLQPEAFGLKAPHTV